MRIFASRARMEMERQRVQAALAESEKRYRDLYEAAPLPVVTLGPDGRIIAANRRFLNWARLSTDAIGRISYADFSVPSAIQRRNELHSLVMGGAEIEEEIEVCPPGGSRYWIRLAQRPIRDENGNIVGAQAGFIDITDRKRAQEALLASEQRYRDLYEAAPLPIVSLGRDGRVAGCNRRFLKWAGLTEDDLPRLSLKDFSTPRTLPEMLEMQTRIMSGEELEIEGSVRTPDGNNHWVSMAARPIRDNAGRVEASQVICLDLTESRKAQRALRASEERLARILASAMDAIVTFDEAKRIELFNAAAEETFRCSAADVLGKSFDPFLSTTLRGALEEAMRAPEATRPRLWIADGLIAKRAGGEEFAVEASISRVEVQRRRLFTLILRDVEELKRAAEERRSLLLQNEYLQEEIRSALNFDEIVGQSRALSASLEQVRLVAGTDSSVLIFGETGTGKELIARAVHSNSPRKNRPLIKVNCATLPTGLIESELFGHEKGAFTGATEKRIGRFELADGGTIFLDEIGEMPPDLQVKLLRVLQEREIERVGGRHTIRVDVRVIAATNRDLQSAVEDGSFRRDLYYRLNVFPLSLPPLRERTEDIPLLVHFFVQRYAAKIGRKISHVSKETMGRLASYRWPGNVRELENVIERAVILSPGSELQVAPEHLPSSGVELVVDRKRPVRERSAISGAASRNAGLSLMEAERDHILAALERCNWKLEGEDGAAAALRLNPSTLRSRLKKLGISRDRAREI